MKKINLKLFYNKIYFILILFISLSISFHCKGKEDKKSDSDKYDTRELIGTWNVIPSEGNKIIFEPGGKVKLVFGNGMVEEVFLSVDKVGLRFLKDPNDRSPFAYFLFSEKRKNIWSGYWNNEIVRMEKEIAIKKSILE